MCIFLVICALQVGAQSANVADNPFELDHRVKQLQLIEQQEIAANPFEKVVVLSFDDTVQVPNTVKKPRKSVSFVFWVTLLVLVLLSLITSLNAQVLTRLYRSFISTNFLKLQHRSQRGLLTGEYIYLYLLYFINMALFLYLLIKNFGIALDQTGFGLYLLILVGIIGLVLMRHTVMAILAWIFPASQELHQYNFTISIFNMFIGMILIPVNVIVAYAPPGLSSVIMYLGIGVFILVFLYRNLRGFLLANRLVFYSAFHFFTYLCAVEIAPILIGLKYAFFD